MKVHKFKKGIHPVEFKYYTSSKKIEVFPLPDDVYIPLQQHFGACCDPLVKKGDEVKTGQLIGASDAFISSPIHATVTGVVKAVDSFPYPAGGYVQTIHIHRTGDDEWDLLPAYRDWKSLSIKKLNSQIRDAGIVGMGGAAFPTHVKLAPPEEKPIDTFILNGCECEPFLTADHRVMVEMAEKVLTGMKILMKVLGVGKGYIGIEMNKPDAIDIMSAKVVQSDLDIQVMPLEVKYPQGAEKMLIYAILKRKVPAGGLPMDVGVVVNNVGTAVSVAEAVTEGKPLIQRVVTVTGDGIKEPKNLLMRIGTPFQHAIEYCNGLVDETAKIFMGGPMMGIAQYDLSVPVVKATSGIVASTRVGKVESQPCIRCGNCVRYCSMYLLPTRLARLSELGNYSEAHELGILNCVECGSCAFECPSSIPLVQWIRVGKLCVGEMLQKQVKN